MRTETAADVRIALIGLGLQAKRFHLTTLQKHSITPALIVDIESNREAVCGYLKKNGLQIDTFFIPDDERDSVVLDTKTAKDLESVCKTHHINRAIIATEPKAHYAFAKFFIELGIDTLIDKPVTTPIGTTYIEASAKRVFEDYEKLNELSAQKNNGQLTVLVQRRYHRAFTRAWQIIDDVIKKYGIPITNIDLHTTEGRWAMPNEFENLENHPYKYGYGALMHAGYHFIDVITWFMGLNEQLAEKSPDTVEVISQIIDPADFMFIVNESDYERLFGEKDYQKHFEMADKRFRSYGEMDSSTVIKYSRNGHTVALVTCSILHGGFSRRSWTHLPVDNDIANGRVRHERMSIEVGPLLNVQLHSYTSYETKDKGKHVHEIFDEGNFEHFDLTIYRNTGIIGGKPYEKIKVSDLYDSMEDALGHKVHGNEACLLAFLENKHNLSSIDTHRQTNQLMSHMHRAIVYGRQGKAPISTYTY